MLSLFAPASEDKSLRGESLKEDDEAQMNFDKAWIAVSDAWDKLQDWEGEAEAETDEWFIQNIVCRSLKLGE